MFSNSDGSDRHYVSAGGIAPQLSPDGFTAKAAAHLSFLACGVASVLFAAGVTVLFSVVSVMSSPSAASIELPAYRQMQPEAICSIASGVCVMRMGAFGSSAAARRHTIEEIRRQIAAPAPTRFTPSIRHLAPNEIEHAVNLKRDLIADSGLDEPAMFAMMNMSADHRHQAIWHYARLNIFELPPFTLSTFRELADRGLAFKPDGSKYHRLTNAASALADAAADHLVETHKIHAPIMVHGRRAEITKQVTLRCTCGWSCGLTAGDRMQAKASRAFTSHLRHTNVVDRLGIDAAEKA